MSLAELFVPRPLPFFRLGLANIPLLLGLTMDAGPYMALLLVKAIGNSYVSGTIFSPFALMSLAQTFASGMAMYGAGKLGERPKSRKTNRENSEKSRGPGKPRDGTSPEKGK